ncbi:SRPBCC family protein [Streptomyces sp. TR06-5]|uniref:SRPBCC family protein n=1 Tax=unclassified Streptomyces TaxID=2593676 RepID=UPI0039A29044
MHTIEETVDVGVPLRTAYNQWTQFTSFPRFMPSVRGVEQVTPTLTRWHVGLGPLRTEFLAEIVEQRPDSFLTWRSPQRFPRHEGEVSFRATAADRTEVTVRLRIDRGQGPGARRAAALTGRVVRRELGHFRDFVEGLGEEVGGWRGTVHHGHVQPTGREPSGTHVPHWPVG